MEKLEEDKKKKKKDISSVGGRGSRGGLPRLYPGGSPGQREEAAGPRQCHSLPSQKEQEGSHLGQLLWVRGAARNRPALLLPPPPPLRRSGAKK